MTPDKVLNNDDSSSDSDNEPSVERVRVGGLLSLAKKKLTVGK